MKYTEKDPVRQILRSLLGLFIAALGQCFTIQASIGYYPWDTLTMGITEKTHISYGTVAMMISIIILLLDLLMKEHIGIGTLLDGFFYGYMVDFWRFLGIMPKQQNMLSGIAVMLVGLAIISYGQYFYMSAGLSCGPRDAFLIALGKRLKAIPIGAVSILIYAVVLVFGYLLGGQMGIGTLIAAFGTGVIIQIVFQLVHFDPRRVEHENAIQTIRRVVSR